ncbi:MAG: pseudaminic acid synthase [Deltaproteobacteria bacterium]|nr:pseudaminic acid synthase [Deltaproteobacteria bacterium]
MTTPSPFIEIQGRKIGTGRPAYIVAEISANHNQSYETAVKMVHAAKEAGADAVKLQTYTPDTMTIDCDNAHFQIGAGNNWAGQTLYQLYSKAYTPWDWQPRLKRLADQLGLHCFSSPFDVTAVDFLEEIGVPAYKIASFELVDIPLIQYIARKGRPIILSTGLAERSEIEEAVRAIRATGNSQIALLKCTSAYPAPPEEMNLKTIPQMIEDFGVPCGLSDHTLGHAVAVAGVALGASIVEKHFTLSRGMESPDAGFSLEPHEFRDLVDGIRTVEKAMGQVRYHPTAKELNNRVFRRSLFVVQDVKAGDRISSENVRSIRPGNGLPPRRYPEVVNRRFTRDVRRGTPLAADLVEMKTV